MTRYQITAYQMCEGPGELPEGTELMWRIYCTSRGADVIMPDSSTVSFNASNILMAPEELAEWLFTEDFLRLASIVNDESGATVLAFKISLLNETEVVLPDSDNVVLYGGDAWEYSQQKPLQLMWSLDDSGSVGAYMLAYPDSEISSSGDIEILTDEEVARAALGAWGEGIPYTLSPTFIYKPDESTGKFVRESEFSEDMS